MNPAIVKFVAIPAFCLLSLVVPKHFNHAHHWNGTYNGYTYNVEIKEHPEGGNISRIEELTVVSNKNGKLIYSFGDKGVLGKPTPQEVQMIKDLKNQLEQKMIQEHPEHGFQGI